MAQFSCRAGAAKPGGSSHPTLVFGVFLGALKLLVCSESAISVPASLGLWPWCLSHCGISPLGSQLSSFAFQGCPGRRGQVGPKGDKVSTQKTGAGPVGGVGQTPLRVWVGLGVFHPEGTGSSCMCTVVALTVGLEEKGTQFSEHFKPRFRIKPGFSSGAVLGTMIEKKSH